jgi:hypothetical protein
MKLHTAVVLAGPIRMHNGCTLRSVFLLVCVFNVKILSIQPDNYDSLP